MTQKEQIQAYIEGKLFKNRSIQRSFSKNFFSDELKEYSLYFDENKVKGSIQEIQLNGVLLVVTNTQVPNGYSFSVSNKEQLFKLYFGINGRYTNLNNKSKHSFAKIPQGHFNFLYQPYVDSSVIYEGNRQKNIQIIFTVNGLQKLLGDDCLDELSTVTKVISEKDNCVFWKNSKPIPNKYLLTIEDIINCTHQGKIRKAYLEAKITELLADFLIMTKENNIGKKTSTSEALSYKGVKKVEKYINKHLKKRITIKDLSIYAGLNVSKLKRDFKKINGITIFKYITRLRMEKAKRLIEDKDYTISQASYEVGYKNPQHFTTAFKKLYGFLPRDLK